MENKQNTAVETVENVNVVVEEKIGLGTKIKNGAKKVFSSKPAKIVGGVLLAAGGAVVGYSFANRNKDDYDDVDYSDDEEFTEYVEDEIPDTDVND